MEPYVNEEFQDFLKLLDESGWDKKVWHDTAIQPPVPFVVVFATPKTFRWHQTPDIEVSVTWHTYGTEDGSYREFNASIHHPHNEDDFDSHSTLAEVITFVKEWSADE